MPGHRVIYKHDQFIEVDTGKRIIPIQDKEYIIIGLGDSFADYDYKMDIGEILDPNEKFKSVCNQYGEKNIVKILNSGERLQFRVGNSKKMKGDESRVYYFVCILLEDLFLFKLRNRSGKDDIDWRLADCKCQLVDCIYGDLKLSDNIISDSLNKLFSDIVMFYFNRQRAAAVNAFNEFFLYRDPNKLIIPGSREREYDNLASIRGIICQTYGKSLS